MLRCFFRTPGRKILALGGPGTDENVLDILGMKLQHANFFSQVRKLLYRQEKCEGGEDESQRESSDGPNRKMHAGDGYG